MVNDQVCEYELKVRKRIMGGSPDEQLDRHIEGCPGCTETVRVLGWMRAYSEQTSVPQLPASGFLLFKARLLDKQTAAKRALSPIIWMKWAAAFITVGGVIVVQAKNGLSEGTILGNTLSSFASVAPIALLATIGAAVLCLAASRFFSDEKHKKPRTDLFQVL